MNDKLVSVIIPAYNVAPYIDKCIDSILKQTYQDIEIIIVDDGSTDETGSIIDGYNSSRIKVIHQENAGVTAARLNGVEHATGYWIGFVDGDDILDKTMYERLVLNAEKNNAQISHCGYLIEMPTGTTYVYGTKKLICYPHNEGISALLEGDSFEPSLCNKIYMHSLFGDIDTEKIKLENIRNMEDLLLNYYLFRAANQTIFEDYCLYHYIKRDNSASTSKATFKKWNDILRVFDILLEEDKGENTSTIKSRITATLTRMTYQEYKENDYIIGAKNRLKTFLHDNNDISRRTRLLGYLCAYVSPLYHILYKAYRNKR